MALPCSPSPRRNTATPHGSLRQLCRAATPPPPHHRPSLQPRREAPPPLCPRRLRGGARHRGALYPCVLDGHCLPSRPTWQHRRVEVTGMRMSMG